MRWKSLLCPCSHKLCKNTSVLGGTRSHCQFTGLFVLWVKNRKVLFWCPMAPNYRHEDITIQLPVVVREECLCSNSLVIFHLYLSFFKSLNITRRSSTVTSKNESGSSPRELNALPLAFDTYCRDREYGAQLTALNSSVS